jgi:hypothetical protein
MNDIDALLTSDFQLRDVLQRSFESAIRSYKKSSYNKTHTSAQRKGEFLTHLRRELGRTDLYGYHQKYRGRPISLPHPMYKNLIRDLLSPERWDDVAVLSARPMWTKSNSAILGAIMSKALATIEAEDIEAEEGLSTLNHLLAGMQFCVEGIRNNNRSLVTEATLAKEKLSEI